MKLLNELISVRRVDNEDDKADVDMFDQDDQHDEENDLCPDCECDPCICDDKDVDDTESDVDIDADSSYGYDEFDLPADDTISPYHEYSDEEQDDDMCRPRVIDIEDEDEETDTKRHSMRNFRKCPMCGEQHGLFDRCPMHGEEDEDEDMIRGQMGAYGQQGAHMGGAKDTDTMDVDRDPDAADELDLGDELGDNKGAETEKGDPKLDALIGQTAEDPNRQGVVRTVKGAHMVYKRQTEDGTYEELWIYNIGNMRDELQVRKAILAGTDIPTNKTVSPDGSQQYELWSAGNAEVLQIKGLPN